MSPWPGHLLPRLSMASKRSGGLLLLQSSRHRKVLIRAITTGPTTTATSVPALHQPSTTSSPSEPLQQQQKPVKPKSQSQSQSQSFHTPKSKAPRTLLPPRPTLDDSTITHTFLKGSGPGGQKINKTASAAQLTHLPTGIVVKSQATRSQSQNYKIARRILAEKVELLERGEESRVRLKEDKMRRRKKSGEKKRRRKYRDLSSAAAADTAAEGEGEGEGEGGGEDVGEEHEELGEGEGKEEEEDEKLRQGMGRDSAPTIMTPPQKK